MPDRYVLDIGMIIPYLFDGMFESLWEAVFVCLEIGPSTFELRTTRFILEQLGANQQLCVCNHSREIASCRQ